MNRIYLQSLIKGKVVDFPVTKGLKNLKVTKTLQSGTARATVNKYTLYWLCMSQIKTAMLEDASGMTAGLPNERKYK